VKRILLTGATGFIGRQTVPILLDRGYEVHAVTSSASVRRIDDGVHRHRADLLEPHAPAELVQRIEPTHLLHLAWYAVPGKFWTAPENVDWLEASLRLLRAFAGSGGQRAVFAGSCAEYEWSDGRCKEDTTRLIPATLYGACKHALQTVGSAFAAQAGLSFAWGRIFFVYGPGEHPDRLVSSVIRSLLSGRPAACSSGEQERDFLHSEDVASAFVQLLDSGLEGPVNIASGVPVSIREVVTTIGALTGRPELIRLGEGPPRADDPPVLVGDIGRLRSQVGWAPRIGLEEGLEQTVEWWRTAGRAVA
jgi:nucleoside-diphosphate-sugar epimerase